MEWKTRVTEILGSKYPIIQGAYGGFGTSAIAGPASAAGGFGIITAGALKTPDKLREDIRKAKDVTDKPFGVNISIGLAAYPEEMLDVVIEEGVPVLFTAAYKADNLGKRAQAAGLKWVHKVATVKHAQAAERQGADAVVIVGIEGTGFKSAIQLPTLITITKAVRLIKVPVIAAGGIGDARGFLGALGMGAEGIYMGTAFMATKECPISDRYKEALIKGEPWDPVYRDRALEPPRKSELDKVMQEKSERPLGEWLGRLERVLLKEDANGATEMPDDWTREFGDEDYDEGLRISGGSLAVGVLEKVVTCKELIDGIIQGAEEMIASGRMGALSTVALGR